ncbi:uncharacterized protein EMH_0076320 [Eimeria mitis]|uniref:Uncharacterized protein n=1 Tax=Eimeria mitis TaxID=44415 RepID=U6K8Q9_9EIME|nr:uncharacterized protein EMH_0076320 [Eimeria mitis]CDJ32602.1 hypothetical protein EMH_0076320 [Eimeria mitis]
MPNRFRRLCDPAQAHILRAKWTQKAYAETHRRDVVFYSGDKVRIRKVAYRLAPPPTYGCHDLFHVSQLIPDIPRGPTTAYPESYASWLPVHDAHRNVTDTYEVNYIMDQRGEVPDDAQYLLKRERNQKTAILGSNLVIYKVTQLFSEPGEGTKLAQPDGLALPSHGHYLFRALRSLFSTPSWFFLVRGRTAPSQKSISGGSPDALTPYLHALLVREELESASAKNSV